jgi:hypothetical protein
MKREDAVRMAREAGFNQPWTAPKETQERLTRFATLAAEWGAKQEREACAKVCDDLEAELRVIAGDGWYFAKAAAAAIRARGEVPR